MRCPICPDIQLVIASREGIEIDHCPQCRGVWLDRGELDKIIDRAASESLPPAPAPQQYAEPRHDAPRRDDRSREQQPYRKKKKEHWLSELFD